MHESNKLRISQLLPNIDLATIFFFLGILMAVGALETSGQLGLMSAFLDKHVHEPYLISFVIGVLSSCVDNVALVAATMGMYPIVPERPIWLLMPSSSYRMEVFGHSLPTVPLLAVVF